jgi:predicted alpha/beta superfamily hydrolase
MRKSLIVTLIFLFGFNQVKSQNVEQIVIGTKQLLHSKILNEAREYWIHLPESYHNSAASYKKYPVLVVLDGNTHFNYITGIVSYMSGIGKIPEMIVVSIQNVDRRRDFTPDKTITVRANNSGGGDKFISFLEDELIPELNRKYRTAPYRILFGHSLGGLLATHAYMKEKTLFNSFISVDPSFGTWDAKTMDKKLDAVTVHSFDRFIYFATANWGKRNIRNRDRHLRLYEALNRKCEGEFPAKLAYFESENHGSVPPIAFYNGISAIFKDYGISFRDIDTTVQLIEHFQSISQRLSWSFKPPELLVNRIGYSMLRGRNENDTSKALEFFLLNTENFPNSFNAYDSMGEAYEVSGNKKKAIEYYKKALVLNPKSAHARMKIENLNKSE